MEYRALGEYCTITSAKRIFADQYVERGIPFFRSREIIEKNNNSAISEPLFIAPDVYESIKAKFGVPQKGDMLLTSVGTIGIPYVVGDEQFYFKDGNLTWMKNFSEDLSPHYLYYWISSKFGRDSLMNSCIGSSQAALTIEILKKYKLFIPSKHTQERIVSILSSYDHLIKLNNKRIKVLEQMAENLYKEWFVRFRFPGYETAEFENGIPKGWRICKVKEIICRLPFGKLYKTEDTEPDGKVIVIDQSTDEFVGFHNDEPSHIASPKNPIAIFGDHSCKYQLMICPFSLSENVVPFTGSNGVLTAYLYYLTKGIVETTEYKRHWTEFVAKKVLAAPLDLQEQFAKQIIPIQKAIQSEAKKNRNLIKQRDLLLPRLMSGKLEV